MMVQVGTGVTLSLWKTPLSLSLAIAFEYPMSPIAVSPIVIHDERTKVAPSLSIAPFQEMRIMTGTKRTRITERRLRHWVVKSALSREDNADEVFGTIVCIVYNITSERCAR